MATFFTKGFTVNETAQLIVESADVDRVVHLTEITGTVYIGFNNVATDGVRPSSGSWSPLIDFVLPAGVELWALRATSTNAYIELVVTSIGR